MSIGSFFGAIGSGLKKFGASRIGKATLGAALTGLLPAANQYATESQEIQQQNIGAAAAKSPNLQVQGSYLGYAFVAVIVGGVVYGIYRAVRS